MANGLFITFEGCEGSGKTTVVEGVVKHLEEKGIKVIKTREPGGIKISEDIRNVILDVEGFYVDSGINEVPNVVPGLREWHGLDGILSISEDTRIVAVNENEKQTNKNVSVKKVYS